LKYSLPLTAWLTGDLFNKPIHPEENAVETILGDSGYVLDEVRSEIWLQNLGKSRNRNRYISDNISATWD
jgi:hypothetical protein